MRKYSNGALRAFLASAAFTCALSAQALSGTYTVDSTQPSGGTNFNNLTDAVAALTSLGVSGPVTMNLVQNSLADFTTPMAWRPLVNAGTSWGGSAILTLDQFPGVSATNHVTFRTAPTSPITPVVFDLAASAAGVGIFFQGADFVTIENIEIKNAEFDAIMFYGETQMIGGTTTPSLNALSTAENNTIKRCRIHDNLGTAITLYGNSAQPGKITIENNFFWNNALAMTAPFNNFGRFGHITGRRNNNVRIRFNSFYQGLPMPTAVATNGTTTTLATCFLGNYNNTGTNFSQVAGNVFHIDTPTVGAGFYHWVNVTAAINNVPGQGTGYATGETILHNKNVYWITPTLTSIPNFGTALGLARANLAAYQAAIAATAGTSGGDTGSIFADPLFGGPTTGVLAVASGSPVTDFGPTNLGIAVDINNLPRLGTAPDAGADEAPVPGAGFFATNTTGAAPLTVNFTDLSFPLGLAPITSWAWDFDGDSVIDSTLQNPSFTYLVPGIYSPSLTISDGTPAGTSTVTAGNLVNVDPWVLTATTTGQGDLTITPVPQIGFPGTAQGYTLLSLATAAPVGTGWFGGITFDPLTLACLQTPASVGNPLHYFTGVPGLYPGTTASAPLALPPGTLSGIFPSGTTLDLVQAMFDGVGNLLGLSNVVRANL